MNEDDERQAFLYSGEDFGITSAADLRALGVRILHVTVDLGPDEAVEQQFTTIPLPERRATAERWFDETFERLRTAFPLTKVAPWRHRPRYRRFDCDLPAEALSRLLKAEGVQRVWVRAVEGMKQKRSKRRHREPLEWYAVLARFAIQAEGQTSGMQTYEDRIVLVKARSFEDAERRLEPEFAEYGRSYFNDDWEQVRWHLERVLDVYQTDLDRLDPDGSEVYSRLRSRRMRPEYEWHPLAETCAMGSQSSPDDELVIG